MENLEAQVRAMLAEGDAPDVEGVLLMICARVDEIARSLRSGGAGGF